MGDLSVELAKAWAYDPEFVELAKGLCGEDTTVVAVADLVLGENNRIAKASSNWDPQKHPRNESGKFKSSGVTNMGLLALSGAALALGGKYAGSAFSAGRAARTAGFQAGRAKDAAQYMEGLAGKVGGAGDAVKLDLGALTKHIDDLKAHGVAYSDEQAQALMDAPANATAFADLAAEHAKVFANAAEEQKALVSQYLKLRNKAARTMMGNALKATAAGTVSSVAGETFKERVKKSLDDEIAKWSPVNAGAGTLALNSLGGAANVTMGVHASRKAKEHELKYRPGLGAASRLGEVAGAAQGTAELAGGFALNRAGRHKAGRIMMGAGVMDMLGAYGLGKYANAQGQVANQQGRGKGLGMYRDAQDVTVDAAQQFNQGEYKKAGKTFAGAPRETQRPGFLQRMGQALHNDAQSANTDHNHWDDWFKKHPEKRDEYKSHLRKSLDESIRKFAGPLGGGIAGASGALDAHYFLEGRKAQKYGLREVDSTQREQHKTQAKMGAFGAMGVAEAGLGARALMLDNPVTASMYGIGVVGEMLALHGLGKYYHEQQSANGHGTIKQGTGGVVNSQDTDHWDDWFAEHPEKRKEYEDKLRKLWDPKKHPRTKEGKFAAGGVGVIALSEATRRLAPKLSGILERTAHTVAEGGDFLVGLATNEEYLRDITAGMAGDEGGLRDMGIALAAAQGKTDEELLDIQKEFENLKGNPQAQEEMIAQMKHIYQQGAQKSKMTAGRLLNASEKVTELGPKAAAAGFIVGGTTVAVAGASAYKKKKDGQLAKRGVFEETQHPRGKGGKFTRKTNAELKAMSNQELKTYIRERQKASLPGVGLYAAGWLGLWGSQKKAVDLANVAQDSVQQYQTAAENLHRYMGDVVNSHFGDLSKITEEEKKTAQGLYRVYDFWGTQAEKVARNSLIIGRTGQVLGPAAVIGGAAYAMHTSDPKAIKENRKRLRQEWRDAVRNQMAIDRAAKQARKDAKVGKNLISTDAPPVVEWIGTFSKIDTDKRQVFGWASVTKLDGALVVDRQGDLIEPDEMEKAAYDYVMNSRVGGDMHKRVSKGAEDKAFHAADMIESIVFTPEKIEKLGLPAGSLPTGWWVGFKVHDEATWQEVKKGNRKGFSIHGRGKRVEKSLDVIDKSLAGNLGGAADFAAKHPRSLQDGRFVTLAKPKNVEELHKHMVEHHGWDVAKAKTYGEAQSFFLHNGLHKSKRELLNHDHASGTLHF